jgi:hypothetical protein
MLNLVIFFDPFLSLFEIVTLRLILLFCLVGLLLKRVRKISKNSVSSVISVCPSVRIYVPVRTEQLASHWKDIH